MPKRKFEEFRDQPRSYGITSSHSRRHERATGQIEHSKTALFRALKIARGFERQKLGRRQKNAAAEKKLDDVRRLKLEVAELKDLNLADTAEIHLYKSLLKIKAIATSDELPNIVRDAVQKRRKVENVENLNVQARLFKAEPVQKAMSEAVDGVKAALEIHQRRTEAKKRLSAKDYTKGGTDMDLGLPRPEGDGAPVSMHDKNEEQDWDGFSSPEYSHGSLRPEFEDDAGSTVDDNNYEYYAARLAASSASDSGSDHSTSLRLRSAAPRASPPTSESTRSTHSVLQTPPSPASPPEVHPPLPNKHSKPLGVSSSTTKTTFLPSLLISGYYSGDSDASSLEDARNNKNDYISSSKPSQRKNRMGQQARRALWEKKFKNKANHLRNGGTREDIRGKVKTINNRDEGWDARKGARSDGDNDRGKGRRDRWTKGATGANRENVDAGRGSGVVSDKERGERRKEGDKGPLHPSWEAARRAKEVKKDMKPVGRKVVFD